MGRCGRVDRGGRSHEDSNFDGRGEAERCKPQIDSQQITMLDIARYVYYSDANDSKDSIFCQNSLKNQKTPIFTTIVVKLTRGEFKFGEAAI